MPKNIEDMIVPEKRRSIRDIPIPEGRKKNGRASSPFAPKEERFSTPSRNNFIFSEEGNKFSRNSRKGKWIAVGVALLILIFAILSIFNGATLAYIPKSATFSFENEAYTARKSGNGNTLSYSVVKLSGDKGLEVSAAGEGEVNRKASGTIVVYNNASTESQRLIENTRFETPNGLVYRISEPIVIPGRRTVSGVVQPGSIEVVVYADEAGEKYNIGLTDFTVPGLAGTARFTTIYARSKTPMSGGFVGREKVVNEQDGEEAKATLKEALKEELILEAKAQVPEDFILISSLSTVVFEDLPQTNSSGKNNATINMRGNLNGVMFKKSDLSNYLAKDKTVLAEGESVDITTLDSLDISFTDTIPVDLLASDEISFSITGTASAVWRTDEIALKADLLGKHKKNVSSILINYPTIVSATATIRPFWKNSFPSDGSRVSIKKLPAK